jgi:hypothetical protein
MFAIFVTQIAATFVALQAHNWLNRRRRRRTQSR